MPEVFVVPGRCNLIGEHTDYNGGVALPVALDLAVTATTHVGGGSVTIRSAPYGTWRDDDRPVTTWQRQAAAVVARLRPSPRRIAVTTSLPAGAGLSSSAAFLGALALACGADGDLWSLARLLQSIERDAGSDVGLLDQLATLGAADAHALLIDFLTEQTEPVSMPASLGLTLLDSGVRRELHASGYRERREECARAAAVLGPLGAVRDEGWRELSDPLLRRRARHVVTECARVRDAVDALRHDDLATFGEMLTSSHRSLRDDFEVSVPDIDELVDEVCATPGVVGARMVGGGFGGCVLVAHDVATTVRSAHRQFRVRAANGALARR